MSSPVKESLYPLHVRCDTDTGRFHVSGPNGASLLVGATASVALASGEVSAGDARFARDTRRVASAEALLPGECTQLLCHDREGWLDLLWHVTALSDRPGVVFELLLTNRSTERIQVLHCEPLRLQNGESGGCDFGSVPGGSRVRKVLTNGRMYHDPGHVADFSPDCPNEICGHFNMAFYEPDTRVCLVVGYLENRQAEGVLGAGWAPAAKDPENRGRFNLTARSQYNDYFVIEPGCCASSGRLLVLHGEDPFEPLETYARLSGALHHARSNPPANAWCSWYVSYGDVTEEEMLRHAGYVARELQPYGMDWIHVDDGYQRSFGDWEGNERFPNGMKGLADGIRAHGLKAGIWVAPYAISAHSDLALNHPDWLVHDQNGELQLIEPDHQAQAQYILDITHPGSRAWLSDLFRTFTAKWGYDFIKIDFVEWTILAARRFHDPSYSKAMAYRLGYEIMRDAIGPTCHLLDCGPAPVALGLIDSMRVQLDRPTPPCTVWEHYWGWYNSVIPAVAKRYFFHKHAWIADADHLRLELLTIPQAQAAVTIIGLSGGPVISGDRLYALDELKLDILKKALPSYGESATPVDLFDAAFAQNFVLHISKPHGEWWLAGCFNGDPTPAVRNIDLAWLGLDAKATWLAYEFWSQTLIGEITGQCELELEPESVKLLVLHEKTGVPQVLGTDRHVTAGAMELSEVQWTSESSTLSGVAHGMLGMRWGITVHVPEGYALIREEQAGFDSLTVEEKIVRGQFLFGASDQEIPWALGFEH